MYNPLFCSRQADYYNSVSPSLQSQSSPRFSDNSRGTTRMALENLSGRGEKSTLRIYEIIHLFEIFFVICTVSAQECFDDGNEFCINQNDILSADLLPGSFLFSDQYKNPNVPKLVINETVDGSFDTALNEMEFHRKRMNEYLCHGYMAEEIFKEVTTPRVKRHPETSPTNDLHHNFLSDDNVTIHDKLLADEGSSKYKNWLQRTTTLNDVYRHYAPHKKIRKKQDVVQHDDIEEFDGEVTGYAMQAPLPSNGKVGVYEPSHEEYYYPPHHQDHHEEEHKPSYSKGKGHDLSIKDFFEIALTALAFLAFGLFIIQLLLNCTDNSGSRRIRRHAISLSSSIISKEDLNELSYRVLRSIEAAMVAEADSGNCLRRTLCEDNQYSKETKDDRRIWIPVWSLGMSWLSGRMLHKTPWSAMLDSVKASVLGLGGIDCASLYPECDLEGERIKRRRRKRR
ncbi:PREDICTED: uncharacterized protein LOC105456550 isoform X2 [Wasmannia auropunctata]|uniref:uncharacterized protein LOC105456550 isoform X2 n=1 Tax=Wasmannia auropunctata TaxID=64793 RepID=UPI0005EE7A31|nr:PREDICTED: uncharacterized protein LOC105456550 isoform X2 [Wasmannia auropunctata]